MTEENYCGNCKYMIINYPVHSSSYPACDASREVKVDYVRGNHTLVSSCRDVREYKKVCKTYVPNFRTKVLTKLKSFISFLKYIISAY